MPVNLSKFAVLTLVFILVAGCAGVHPASRIIVQDPQTIVRLDIDTSIKGPDDPDRYTHPAEIEVGQLQKIFAAIRIQPQLLMLQKKRDIGVAEEVHKHRVFETDEIATLASIVKDAFSQASPQERVVFGLTKPSGIEAETHQEATWGEMYIKDQQLHFILSCHRLSGEGGKRFAECRELTRQGFELSFTQKERFVGFGKPRILFGNGTKELIIGIGIIASSTPTGL
ncbi:MAG: hypothetical protein CMH81_08530 [Nitrospiraceae bacterium]|nr:hypothetical protein [Nitrospiraceae bacterium]|tara:strand:+ start:389 stop:1069 length:681 start_codon:yes stop_codon:yes gene_type:complete